ncbi:SCP-2 sterol transfer family protein [Brevibacillus sp. GCM10020057]|uniref:SCP-2 sterol transfer family protein n=1 Tax=Brevibacillus sp. GCM10020057 TaxID=3317327 RepID=UPI00362D2E07
MIGIGRLLAEVAERLQRRPHIRFLTVGWEKRVGIVAVDTKLRWQLTFSQGSASWGEWREEQSADLVLHGREKLIRMLLAGDELQYLSAKQQVRFSGTVRDQLKLDAILRLTSK